MDRLSASTFGSGLPPALEPTHHMLRNERQRALLLMAVLAGTLGLSIVAGLATPASAERASSTVRALRGAVLLLAMCYTLTAIIVLGRMQRTRRQPAALLRYATALIEASVPTAILVLTAEYAGYRQALVSPPSYLYFLVILLATLRLDFRLCAFTGAVAAVQYLSLALYYGDPAPTGSAVQPGAGVSGYAVRSVLILVGGLLAGYVAEQIRGWFVISIRSVQERDRIRAVFGQYVSAEVVDRLLAQPAEPRSDVRIVCVMFLDIRNFTAFAEEKAPETVLAYLNTLFAFMVEAVNRHHGIINKFLGDGFMAVFGAPLSGGHDTLNAVRAGREILSELAEYTATQRIPPTRIGIGLHRGEAVTGAVGAASRKEYAVIGDVVNVAARVEQATKEFGAQFLVSEAVWDDVKAAITDGVPVGPVQVHGRHAPVELYRLA